MMLDKELFDLLYEASKSIYSAYVYNVWTTTALLVASIGWFLTSDHARIFLGQQGLVRKISIASLSLLALFHSLILFITQYKSQSINLLLESAAYVKDNHIPQHYYSQYLVPNSWPYASSFLNFILFYLLIYFILSTPKFINNNMDIKSN
ncbi:MAG: hypothetical protein OQL19_07610 [Gammaproteobacteria bacterium]|nr:hypothetical protein [Gammaproteobacteria bacterium]